MGNCYFKAVLHNLHATKCGGVVHVFLYISNTINPVIYAGMNSSFKSEFHRIIMCQSSRLVTSQSLMKRNPQGALGLQGQLTL